MPKIINAYAANDSIADSLRSLGESMFGSGAKDEAARQAARSTEQDVVKKSRENAFTPMIAGRITNHDYGGATSAAINAGMDPKHLGGYQQYYDVNREGPASERGTRATMSVPGANYGHTVPGSRESLRSAEDIHAATNATSERNNAATNATTLKSNDMTTARLMQQKQWDDEHTFVDLESPDGTRVIKVTKSEVPLMQGQGYRVARSLDQVKANLVSPPQQSAPPSGGVGFVDQGGAPSPTMAAPGTQPRPQQAGGLGNLTQDQRSIVGLPTGTQQFIHGATGSIGVSKDGGQTILLPNGTAIPAIGSGYQPVSAEAALSQTRANNMSNKVNATPAPSLDYGNGAVSQDAYKASGVDAALTREANNSFGSVLGPVIGEIGAPTQRATERLAAAVNAARTALLSNQFRQTNWSQQQMDTLLPQGAGYANPVTASNSIGAVVRELGMEESRLRHLILDPSTPLDTKHKAYDAWEQTHRAIAMFTAPVEAPQAPGASAQAAPQTGPAGDPLGQARDAIARGAPRAAVIQRLQQNGIDPAGL